MPYQVVFWASRMALDVLAQYEVDSWDEAMALLMADDYFGLPFFVAWVYDFPFEVWCLDDTD